MPGFILIAALLTVVALAILLLPLLRRRATARVDRTATNQATNLAIFRDQFAELERERTEGMLSAENFDPATLELENRLLEETASGETPAAVQNDGEDAGGEGAAGTVPVNNPARGTAWALIFFLPLFAAACYAWIGNTKALDPANTQPPAQQAPFSAGQIEEMVERLAQRMRETPDDVTGWRMLARSYRALERYPEAVQAYEQLLAHLPPETPPDADTLLDYAESLAATQQSFSGKPAELIDQALKLAPDTEKGLLLAALAAGEREDFDASTGYFERLLKLLPSDSEEAKAVTDALAQLRAEKNKKEGKKESEKGTAEKSK